MVILIAQTGKVEECFEGMEESCPAVVNQVLAEAAAYDPGRYGAADAVRAFEAAESSGSRGLPYAKPDAKP
jgi:hypothetical protein